MAALLSAKESERQGLLAAVSVLDAEIDAYRVDLEAARRQAYEEVLDTELGAHNLAYTLEEDEALGTYVVSLFSTPGGETELGRIKAAWDKDDVSSVSTNFLLNYLNVPLPWSSL